MYQEIKELRTTSVQTLSLLALIEINDGNESQASVLFTMDYPYQIS